MIARISARLASSSTPAPATAGTAAQGLGPGFPSVCRAITFLILSKLKSSQDGCTPDVPRGVGLSGFVSRDLLGLVGLRVRDCHLGLCLLMTFAPLGGVKL